MSQIKCFLILGLLVALAGCQLPGAGSSGAREGYFTWVDEQGRVRYSPIPEGQPEPGEANPESLIMQAETRASAGPEATSNDEYNLDNYPDGDELAKRGNVRPGDPEPYFTWRDARGNVRVSYYRPDLRTAVEKGEIKPPLELTEARIYLAGREPSDSQLPQDADPLASEILGLTSPEAPFMTRWLRACCKNLDRSDFVDWEPGREFGVEVDTNSMGHEFVTGESRYRLVRLPHGSSIDDFILRVRSFDLKGVFVPTFAFLDERFQPLRLVTDVVAEFIPESWHRHGHLRSFIPVFPNRGERWLLIYTTSDDLAKQTVIDTRFGPKAIQHVRTGELGLQKVED